MMVGRLEAARKECYAQRAEAGKLASRVRDVQAELVRTKLDEDRSARQVNISIILQRCCPLHTLGSTFVGLEHQLKTV